METVYASGNLTITKEPIAINDYFLSDGTPVDGFLYQLLKDNKLDRWIRAMPEYENRAIETLLEDYERSIKLTKKEYNEAMERIALIDKCNLTQEISILAQKCREYEQRISEVRFAPMKEKLIKILNEKIKSLEDSSKISTIENVIEIVNELDEIS